MDGVLGQHGASMDLAQQCVGNHLDIHNENITKDDLVIILLHDMEEVIVQDLRFSTNTSNVTHITVKLMVDGNLLDFGQTGVIVVNHVMEDLDGEHEKGTVPTQVQSMAENTVLEPIHKQLLKHATHLHVLVFVYVLDLEILITTHLMTLLYISWEHVNILCGSRPYQTIDASLGLRQRMKDVMETTMLHTQGS